MVRKSTAFALLFLLVGLGAGYAAQPKSASLKDAWQGLAGKCGQLEAKSGLYQFQMDETLPGEGALCVLSVGTDVVVFGSNPRGSMLSSPKPYLLVPMDRIVMSLVQ